MTRKFTKPPLSPQEKEKKAEQFLNFMHDKSSTPILDIENQQENIRAQREKIKPLALRFPQSLADDLKELSNLTCYSINTVCVELLRSAVKHKLKELKG